MSAEDQIGKVEPVQHVPSKEIHRGPVFDAGIFTILHASPKGFNIVVDENLRRRDIDLNARNLNGEPVFRHTVPIDKTLDFTTVVDDKGKTEVDILRERMGGQKGEVEFAQSNARKAADREGREQTPQDYVNAMTPKIGIRELSESEGPDKPELHLKTRPVTYPLYSDLVNRASANRPEAAAFLDFAEATGTAAAIFTADSDLILQYRGTANRAYGNIPGASAAGLQTGTFDRSSHTVRGRLTGVDPLTELRKEITEELQIDANNVAMEVLGVAHDEIKPHHEFISIATLPETSQELVDRGLIPDDTEGHDFKERYFTIPGTPKSIETLLAQVKCPLPSTHAAAFFMAGYYKVAQEQGEDAAIVWGQRTATAIKKNYEEIDDIVRKRYNEFPNQIGNKPERSRSGYDPLYFPEQQGLPSLLPELLRTELITPEMYRKLHAKYSPDAPVALEAKETEKVTPVAWILDADGVLTHPELKKRTEEEFLTVARDAIQKGQPFVINTGRTAQWAYDNFIADLEATIEDKSLLRNIFIVGEKGNAWMEYQNQEWHTEFDESVLIPDELKNGAFEIIREKKYRDTMYEGEEPTKRTMVSPEMKTGTPHDVYRAIQGEFSDRLKNLVQELGLEDTFKVDATAIAVDIEPKNAGKGRGVERALEWLKRHNIRAEYFETIGDSPSDKEMADRLHQLGFPVQFAFVGKKDQVQKLDIEHTPYPVTVTSQNNEKGALEYMKMRAAQIT